MSDSNSHRQGLLRRAGRDLTHELKNQLGIAMGSLDLVRDQVQGDLTRRDLDRALHALIELDLLVTEAQLALRREEATADAPDLVALLREGLELFSLVPGNESAQIRHRLPDKPVYVCYPEEALQEILGRLLTGSGEAPLDLVLQEELSEPDPNLPKGRYCALLARGGRSRMHEEGWSFEAERFRARTLGGDLRCVDGGVLLLLPLAGQHGAPGRANVPGK